MLRLFGDIFRNIGGRIKGTQVDPSKLLIVEAIPRYVDRGTSESEEDGTFKQLTTKQKKKKRLTNFCEIKKNRSKIYI